MRAFRSPLWEGNILVTKFSEKVTIWSSLFGSDVTYYRNFCHLVVMGYGLNDRARNFSFNSPIPLDVQRWFYLSEKQAYLSGKPDNNCARSRVHLEKTCTLRLNMLADNYPCWGSLDFDFYCWFSGWTTVYWRWTILTWQMLSTALLFKQSVEERLSIWSVLMMC